MLLCEIFSKLPLIEAPIADFEFMGSPDPHTFDANDLKAIRNPKWKAKLLSTFARTPFPINIYLLNQENGKFINRTIHEPMSKLLKINPELDDLKELAGCYSVADFERNFGFVPRDANLSLSVMLTNNFGDGKIALTPWIIAHRIIHAVASSNHHWTRNSDANLYMNAFWHKLGSLVGFIGDQADRTNSPKLAPRAERWNQIFALASDLKSAQAGYDRVGEFYVELATQYFLYGKFKFDIERIFTTLGIEYTEDSREPVTDYTWQISYSRHAHHLLDEAREELANMMSALEGQIFVM